MENSGDALNKNKEESSSKVSEEFEEHLPSKSKIAYALANGANMLLSGLGLGQIMFFYTVRLGMDTSLQGLAWLIFAAWNAINDPLLGILEEKTKSPLGRRVPYLRYGAAIYSVLFILIWFPFASSDNQIGLFFNLLLMLFLFDTVYSMIGLVTYSLPAEMAITAKERGSIMVYSTMVGFVVQILGFLLPIVFLSPDRPLIEWQIIMVIVSIVSGLVMYKSSFYIKENRWAQAEPTLGFIESIKETFKNKQFLIYEISIFSLLIVQTITFNGVMFLVNYVVVLEGITSYIYAVLVVLVLIAYIFFAQKIIPKVGVKKIYVYGSLIGGIGFALLPFSNRTMAGLFVPLSFIMIYLGSQIMGQQPLMADVIDYDEVLTGKRRETTYSGVNALITKPAISIANWAFLKILKDFGYVEGSTQQPPSVADGIIFAYSVIPVICILISTFAMKFFKLDGEEWFQKKQELQRIHQEKEKAFIEKLIKENKLDMEEIKKIEEIENLSIEDEEKG